MHKILTLFTCFVFYFVGMAQNVGIGTTSPAVPLDVRSISASHLLRLDGNNSMYASINENGVYRGYLGSFSGNAEDVDFGTGSGNSTGKVHLTIQGNPRFTVGSNGNVGIGTTNPAWKLDVNGGMQLQGRLVVNNTSGTTGQVLTSNGSGTPTWESLSQPFSDKIRFAATFNQSPASFNTYCVFNTPAWYNLSPTKANLSATGIVLSTAGLYHFDVYVQAISNLSATPPVNPSFGLRLVTNNTYPFVSGKVMETSNGSGTNFIFTDRFSIDVQVEAGQEIRFYHNFSGIGTTTSFTVYGVVNGHLISE